jgi:hypothetical protein
VRRDTCSGELNARRGSSLNLTDYPSVDIWVEGKTHMTRPVRHRYRESVEKHRDGSLDPSECGQTLKVCPYRIICFSTISYGWA